MNNRIRNLDLRLSLPAELRARSQQLAERLRDGPIDTLVARIAERFHARFGDEAIIEIDRLDVTWGGDEAIIGDFEYACRLGDELADELLAELDDGAMDQPVDRAPGRSTGDGAPRSTGRVTVYRDRVHQASMRLITLAARHRQRASLAGLEHIEQEWRTVCERGADAIVRAAASIGNSGEASTVCDALKPAMLELAIRVSPLSRWPEPMRGMVASRLLRSDEIHATEAGRSRMQDGKEPLEQEASTGPADAPPTSMQDTPDPAQPPSGNASAPRKAAAPRPALAEEKADEQSESPVDSARHTRSPTSDSTPSASDADSPRGVPSDAVEPSGLPAALPESIVDTAPLEGAATRYGGLVYLLNLMLRIELPEILWCCGIDEGSFVFDVLDHCTRAERSDILIAGLSGVGANLENHRSSGLPQWALSEVVDKTYERLAKLAQGPHFKVDSLHKAEILATVSNGRWRDAVVMVAEMLQAAFLDLIGAASGDDLETYIAIDGTLVQSDGALTIRIPMAAIEMGVRRAGLDKNPGLLVWSRTRLTIDFFAGDTDESTSI